MVEFPAQLLNYLVIKINHFSFKQKKTPTLNMCKLGSTFLSISDSEGQSEEPSEEPGPHPGPFKNKFIPLLRRHERGKRGEKGGVGAVWVIAGTPRSGGMAHSYSN